MHAHSLALFLVYTWAQHPLQQTSLFLETNTQITAWVHFKVQWGSFAIAGSVCFHLLIPLLQLFTSSSLLIVGMCQLCMQSAAVNWPADHAVGSTADVTEHAWKGQQSNTRCRAFCRAVMLSVMQWKLVILWWVVTKHSTLPHVISATQTHTSSGIIYNCIFCV